MEKKTVKEAARKGAALGLAFLCSIGMLLAGRAPKPTELADIPEPAAIIAEVHDEAEDEQRRRALTSAPRRAKAKKVLRTLAALPLWAIGSVLLWAGKKLMGLLSAAFLPPLLHLITLFCLLCLAFLLLARLLFPDLRLSEIFTPHALTVLAVGSVLLEAVDFFFSRLIDNFSRFGLLYFFVGGLVLLGLALLPAAQKQRAARAALQDPAEIKTSITAPGSTQSGKEA